MQFFQHTILSSNLPLLQKHVPYIPQKRNNTKAKNILMVIVSLLGSTAVQLSSIMYSYL